MNKQNNNGGPAFPFHSEQGMNLRDYFAAAALQGLMAHHGGGFKHAQEIASEIADDAFYIADRMLAKRMEQP